MKKTYIHLLLMSIFSSSVISQPMRAMDETESPEDYTYMMLIATTALASGLVYTISKCCRGSASPTHIASDAEYLDFSDWKKACEKLPTNNQSYKNTALELTELMRVVRAYTKHEMHNENFLQNDRWLGNVPSEAVWLKHFV